VLGWDLRCRTTTAAQIAKTKKNNVAATYAPLSKAEYSPSPKEEIPATGAIIVKRCIWPEYSRGLSSRGGLAYQANHAMSAHEEDGENQSARCPVVGPANRHGSSWVTSGNIVGGKMDKRDETDERRI